MNKVSFAIAIHFHQPIGNFQHIFERAYKFCYEPFLQLFSDYPSIKLSLHISGCLLDYLNKNHHRIIKLIKCMSLRQQIEIIGGGYYEPIIMSIPRKDAIGQIKMMSEYAKDKFGVIPKGMWLAERIWHPDIADTINKSGMRYVILDDEHLLRAGVANENMHGYFLTGRGKNKIAVFPSDKKLRYLIPFKLPNEAIEYLKKASNSDKKVLFTYGDDAEKFGEWPRTYEWVFTKHWLSDFFDLLGRNQDWLELVHFSDYLKKNMPIGSIDIPQASYKEMIEWSGGSWMNFLAKYPEANQMHKKMLHISSKIAKIDRKAKQNDRRKIKRAKKELYMGQCNCGYWHGVFGGLYLYHLRKAIYSHLIEADKITDRIKKQWFNIQRLDYDHDGKKEVIIETQEFSLYIDVHEGGVIKELDYKPLSLNLVNALSRKREFYHEKILKHLQDASSSGAVTIHDDFRMVKPSLKKDLIYDKSSRYFLRSYFFKKDLSLECFSKSAYEEIGEFSTLGYNLKIKNKKIALSRKSKILDSIVELRKEIKVQSKNEIDFSCYIKKRKPDNFNVLFGLEFNITMPDLNSDRYYYDCDKNNIGDLNSQGTSFPEFSFGISDGFSELSIKFNFSKKPMSIFYFPVKTVSQSERAYELNYQCSCMLFLWSLGQKTLDEFHVITQFIPKIS